jgi:ubiquinone/menaquinone biosynthesis C-methylase UbiE
MFSKEWNIIYKNRNQVNEWPWDNLISFFNNYFKNKKNIKVLELGFGTANNSIFFIKNNIDYTGIEGSKKAVEIAKKRFPLYKNSFILGDFTKQLPINQKYDLIFDRGAITHNVDKSVINTISMIKSSLKENGLFFGIDWFSSKHYLSKKGRIYGGESNSRVYTRDMLKNVGVVNFFNKKKIEKLFRNFKILQIEEKNRIIHKKKNKIKNISFYNIIVKKKSK